MDTQMTILREERQELFDLLVARLEAIETRVTAIETLLASLDKKLKVVK